VCSLVVVIKFAVLVIISIISCAQPLVTPVSTPVSTMTLVYPRSMKFDTSDHLKGVDETTYVLDANFIVGSTSHSDYTTDGVSDEIEINSALSALTAGRTWKERVVLEGDFSISSPINVPSYTILDIQGKLKQAVIDIDIIYIENQSEVVIVGGEIEGLGSNAGTTGWGIKTDVGGENIQIYGIYVHDTRKSGIALNNIVHGAVSGCRVQNTGFNGIGIGDSCNITIRDNYCHNNADSGVNLEDVSSFLLVNNTCTNNVRHNLQLEHACEGQIIGGIYKGSQKYHGIEIRNRVGTARKSKEVVIIGAHVECNYRYGIYIYSSESITVLNCTVKNNSQRGVGLHDGIRITDDGTHPSRHCRIEGNICFDDQATVTQNYGIREASISDYNLIIENDVRGNCQALGIRYVGVHTVVERNLS